MDTNDHMREALSSLRMTKWGLSAVDAEGVRDNTEAAHGGGAGLLRCAVTMYKAYELPPVCDPLRGGAYDEKTFHEMLVQIKDAGLAEVDRFCAAMDAEGIRHWAVPRGQDPDTLIGPFSQKRAAARAGLGWIGRSSLFVTHLYGPRVVLFTVLLDIDPPKSVLALDGCGDCRDCVGACPYGYLRGAAWTEATERERLIDAHTCSATMEKLGAAIGRKHACGRCLLACPLGLGEQNDAG